MLLLPKFDYEEPKSLPEALRVLAELRGAARVVAGGTDLLVNMKRKTININTHCLLWIRSERSCFNDDFCCGGGTILSFVVRKVIKKNMIARILKMPMVIW